MSTIRANVLKREAMIVGARKVNGFHGLLQFWSFWSIAELASGLCETSNLLVKCVKALVWSLLCDSKVSTKISSWLNCLDWVRLLEDDSWPPEL